MRRLALAERSGFGWGRAWCFLRFNRKVGCQPFGHSAFEDANLQPFLQQHTGDSSADQLIRIRIVGDDVAAAWDGYRINGIWRHADGAGQLYRAVLVSVFQANIQNRGLVATLQTLLQLFFADAFDGHGAILAVRRSAVKVWVTRTAARG